MVSSWDHYWGGKDKKMAGHGQKEILTFNRLMASLVLSGSLNLTAKWSLNTLQTK